MDTSKLLASVTLVGNEAIRTFQIDTILTNLANDSGKLNAHVLTERLSLTEPLAKQASVLA